MPSEFKKLPIDQLHFDPQNPRLPHSIDGSNDEAVINYLLLEEGLLELMGSIAEQGYFEGEPLLVVESEPDNYVVVEGNRRLAALKVLISEEPAAVKPQQIKLIRETAKERPTEAQTLIFPSKDDILEYLGYRHITGIKQWSSLQKARYLKLLVDRSGQEIGLELFRSIAKEIGSRSDYVAKLLTGLSLVERARDTGLLQRAKILEDDIPFSVLTTAIGYSGICEFIGLTGSTDVQTELLKDSEFREFFLWCFDRSTTSTVLGESRNLEKLASVVVNQRAVNELRRSSNLEEAYLFTSGPLDVLRKVLIEVENSISNAQRNVPLLDGVDTADIEQANRIAKAARALYAALNALGEAEDGQA